jgi:oligopeptidase A
MSAAPADGSSANNPLLGGAEHPDYASVRAEHVVPAIALLLDAAEAALEHAVTSAVPATYDDLSRVLDVAVERLRHAWGIVAHLQAVADSPSLREAHAAMLPRVTAFHTALGSDGRLFAKYRAVAASSPAAALTPARRKALDDTLRDFRLGGAELQGPARERYAAIQARMAELSQRFGENVLDATDDYALVVDPSRLAGVPAHVVEAACAQARADGVDGARLTLHAPCLTPVLRYAEDRSLREALYRASHTLASEFGPPEWDNTALMRELVSLRDEEARLLGFASYADLSLVRKMARTPETVFAFIADASHRARPHAERDLAEARTFAADQLGLRELEGWDRPFVAEKLRQSRFALSGAEVEQYFTEPRVLQGLFQLVETLFEVTIRPAPTSVWHESVRFFEVLRDGRLLASFYLDSQARPGKQSGAWMDEVQTRWLRPDSGRLQRPVAHLVCNFGTPQGGKPSLLAHDDVVTVFHEFGHGLHHMLTQIDDLAVAGISGVEWDAVELPSQFMENFCWEWDVVSRLTAHVETGEPLPRELFDKMVVARKFQSGLRVLRSCEDALFDMRLHSEPGAGDRIAALAESVNAEVAVVRQPAFMRYPNAFTHLFDGGYAAGYYGYAWAEVLSADAFAAFEEKGLFDAETGRRFRTEVLEAGGSRPTLESFVAFRGREPRLDAWLAHQGIA